MAHQASASIDEWDSDYPYCDEKGIVAPGDAHKGQRLIITPEDTLDSAQASGEWIGAERILDLNACQ